MSSRYDGDDELPPDDDESGIDDNDREVESHFVGSTTGGNGDGTRRRITAPAEEPVRPPRRESADPRETTTTHGSANVPGGPCVMIGPTGSGKTTLLIAIGRACSLDYGDGLKLEFVSEESTANKIKETIGKITGRQGGPEASYGKPDQYPFWIHASERPRNFWDVPLDTDLYVVMGDATGEHSFPSAEEDMAGPAIVFRDELLDMAANAGSLIFCVDVTKPRAAVLERELPVLLSRITRTMNVRTPVPWQQRVRDWLQKLPVQRERVRRRRCLNASRFLLLLTQVDKLCHKLNKPAWHASVIDPVGQARDLLGPSLLNSIQSALQPGATFAVGICSAWGFHPATGRPFADQYGMPINLAAESGEEILRRWTPYGIRDAIYFLATGKCRGRVKQVIPKDLEIAENREAFEFSYREANK